MAKFDLTNELVFQIDRLFSELASGRPEPKKETAAEWLVALVEILKGEEYDDIVRATMKASQIISERENAASKKERDEMDAKLTELLYPGEGREVGYEGPDHEARKADLVSALVESLKKKD